MNIATLSFGASLLASGLTLLIYLHDLKPYQLYSLLFFVILGLFFLAHGTGFLRENIINPILRRWRIKHPKIAIINDLPWSSEKRTFAWAWSEMKAEKWQAKLRDMSKNNGIKTKVNLIKVKKSRARYFIERYNVIINPYGSVYPETNIKELSVWNTISSYVLNGGVIVSLADIPFYYAYDESKEISYDLIRPAQIIPTEYEQVGPFLKLRPGSLTPIATFSGTPFLSETHVPIFNTERSQKDGTMVTNTLKLKEQDPAIEIDEVKNVLVNRAFLVGSKNESIGFSNIRSIVQEIEIDSQYFTPICYIDFGKGHYLVSSLFLEYNLQPDVVKRTVTNLMASLVLKEIRKVN